MVTHPSTTIMMHASYVICNRQHPSIEHPSNIENLLEILVFFGTKVGGGGPPPSRLRL
jgi:hypothetical protein